MKLIITLIVLLSVSISFSQTTSIPDPAFEQALIDLGIDKDVVDGVVSTASVSNISYLNIFRSI